MTLDDAALRERAKEVVMDASKYDNAVGDLLNDGMCADLIERIALALRSLRDAARAEQWEEIVAMFRYWQEKVGSDLVPWQIMYVQDPRTPLTDAEIQRGQEIATMLRAQEEKA